MDQAELNALAQELDETGKTPEAIAKALYNGDNAEDVAQALYASEGANLSATEVAQALGSPEGWDLDVDRVIEVLYSDEGLDLSAVEVAEALHDGLDLSIKEVAEGLYASLSVNEVAHALYFGIGCKAETVATTLDTLDCSHSAIDDALKYIGIGRDDEDEGVEARHQVMYAADLESAEDVASRLYREWDCNNRDTAYALIDDYGFSAAATAQLLADLTNDIERVALALYASEGADLSADQVAQALYSDEGLDLSADQVAQALYASDGLDLDAAEVAEALSEGLKLTAEQVAEALESVEGLDYPPPSSTVVSGTEITVRTVDNNGNAAAPQSPPVPTPSAHGQDGPDLSL